MSYEFILRIIVIALFTGRFLYWRITEKKADTAKPKTKPQSRIIKLEKIIIACVWILVIMQLLGLQVFPLKTNFYIIISGFLLVITAMTCSIIGRKNLGTNWAHAVEYQIKKEHALITTGVYKYIRHPIYTGMLLSFIGAEIMIGSKLSIIFFIFLPLIAYIQARKEEKILHKHFGNEYATYMKKSKMFIPYVW